ncbi:MAG TPA: SGNH/GDSL hydrolase family protein [Actinophytocola sp.]|uniref:SGNH/GDSL hydrolase family protein n=1 Tax=Actinophytocola sp. TaxID=1872138 RepID=UPI002DDD4E81|nr:SGNH/GDSL hydrolase family protein [Actinophytocola sp.]HEV2778798.1 SGNH/GDSL hydrolase family protein [Actinophytocola sp.]
MTRRVAGVLALLFLVSTVIAPAGVASATGRRYVALGDSAAAGPLIPLPDLSAPGCLRSTNNYPKLVARRLGVPITDVTCSGAVTADMTNPQETELGTVPPQFDALGPDTTLVTVQIGGNDAGLVGLALDCVNLLPEPFGTSCADRNTAGGRDVYGERIAGVAPRIAAVLDGIHQRAPNAAVYIVGYTTYLPPNGCHPLVPLWARDANYIQAKIDQLNQVFVAEAGAHGATYIDIRTPGIGKDVCKSPLIRWTEPLVPLNVAAPLHPNATGMIGMAQVVTAGVS